MLKVRVVNTLTRRGGTPTRIGSTARLLCGNLERYEKLPRWSETILLVITALAVTVIVATDVSDLTGSQ